MSKFFRYFLLTAVVLGLLLSTTVVAAGCGSTSTTTSATATTATSTVIPDRALKVFSSNQVGGDWGANSISGTKLAAKLADPAQASSIYLMDIRSKDAYNAGHIQGAVQVDFAQWAAKDNLDKLAKLPPSTKIVVVCYTGNTAAQTAAGLRMLGYDANVLKEGMNGWAQTDTTTTVVADLANTNYPDFTTPAGTSAPAGPATTFSQPSSGDYQVIADNAAAVMAAMPTSGDYNSNTIKAATLSGLLAGANKPFVLDIRKTDDFNKGHIDGAVHIDFAAVGLPENLQLLPKDKKIVVACYTGNTAAQAMMVLRMLGYDAATLKYGMMGWDGGGKDTYLNDIQNANNPIVKS